MAKKTRDKYGRIKGERYLKAKDGTYVWIPKTWVTKNKTVHRNGYTFKNNKDITKKKTTKKTTTSTSTTGTDTSTTTTSTSTSTTTDTTTTPTTGTDGTTTDTTTPTTTTTQVPIDNYDDALKFGQNYMSKISRSNGHTIELKVIGGPEWKIGEWCIVEIETFNETDETMFIEKVSSDMSGADENITTITLVDYPPSLSSGESNTPNASSGTDATTGTDTTTATDTSSTTGTDSSSTGSTSGSGGSGSTSSTGNKSKKKVDTDPKTRTVYYNRGRQKTYRSGSVYRTLDGRIYGEKYRKVKNGKGKYIWKWVPKTG